MVIQRCCGCSVQHHTNITDASTTVTTTPPITSLMHGNTKSPNFCHTTRDISRKACEGVPILRRESGKVAAAKLARDWGSPRTAASYPVLALSCCYRPPPPRSRSHSHSLAGISTIRMRRRNLWLLAHCHTVYGSSPHQPGGQRQSLFETERMFARPSPTAT